MTARVREKLLCSREQLFYQAAERRQTVNLGGFCHLGLGQTALSEDGDTFVFQAGPEFRLLHANSLDEMCMATPAMAGDRLLIRTLTKLYCIRKTR